jgi:hypothetical protein
VPLGQGPFPESPVTLPGWGAVPALLGVVLAVLGLFVFQWVGDASFVDLNQSITNAASEATALTGGEGWIKVYFTQGVFVALVVAAVVPSLWALGSLRNQESIRRRGGVLKKSLGEGRTGPARVLVSVIAGLCLAYHVISLLVLTRGGQHLGDLGPGPWLLVAGTALSVAGAVIGPRVPRRPGWRPN